MSEGVRYCWRCHEPIRAEEESKTYDIISASGPGMVVEIHTPECPTRPPLYQRVPVAYRR